MGRADDIACLLTQPGNVVMGQAADRQGAPDNDTYLAAVDRGPDRFPPRWPDRQVPWTATGTTGTWLATAMMKAPSLNSPIVPSGEILPSG